MLSIPFETTRVSQLKGEQLEKEKAQKKKTSLFDQIFFESENMKLNRRKVSEVLRRVRCWFNKEFSQSEPLPPEFKDYEHQREIDKNRARDLWQKYF